MVNTNAPADKQLIIDNPLIIAYSLLGVCGKAFQFFI